MLILAHNIILTDPEIRKQLIQNNPEIYMIHQQWNAQETPTQRRSILSLKNRDRICTACMLISTLCFLQLCDQMIQKS